MAFHVNLFELSHIDDQVRGIFMTTIRIRSVYVFLFKVDFFFFLFFLSQLGSKQH